MAAPELWSSETRDQRSDSIGSALGDAPPLHARLRKHSTRSINFVVAADVFEHRAVVRQKRKHHAHIILDRETPLFAQLARQLVGSEPGIVRVNGEDFHPPPELLFQILPTLDSLLKGALKGRTESDLRHHAANDFFKSPMELENLSLPRFTSSRLRR